MALTRQELEDNIIAAAEELAETFQTYTCTDIGPALTCSEADALASLFRAVGALSVSLGETDTSDLAGALMDAHKSDDDEEEADNHE